VSVDAGGDELIGAAANLAVSTERTVGKMDDGISLSMRYRRLAYEL
jgi:hypothetical protein